ncbi:MAG: hypothetical protein M1482_05855 [Chloroflexi bacterium]|nr:hypothetical protein [Chloroflexota bacterium]
MERDDARQDFGFALRSPQGNHASGAIRPRANACIETDRNGLSETVDASEQDSCGVMTGAVGRR